MTKFPNTVLAGKNLIVSGLEEVKQELLTNGVMVSDALGLSLRALVEHDQALAEKVIGDDYLIDLKEVAIENRCLEMLESVHVVGHDLRFLMATLKINSDLERIADLASNISHRVLELGNYSDEFVPALFAMGEKAQQMLEGAIDALVNCDTALARDICKSDHFIDESYGAIYRELKEKLATRQVEPIAAMSILMLARHLERIGDHATNIAEDVLFLVEGHIVRHNQSLAQHISN